MSQGGGGSAELFGQNPPENMVKEATRSRCRLDGRHHERLVWSDAAEQALQAGLWQRRVDHPSLLQRNKVHPFRLEHVHELACAGPRQTP